VKYVNLVEQQGESLAQMSKFALCAKARVRFCRRRVSFESAQPVIAVVDKAGLLRIHATVAMVPDNRK
jgi:hypothetical protein